MLTSSKAEQAAAEMRTFIENSPDGADSAPAALLQGLAYIGSKYGFGWHDAMNLAQLAFLQAA